MIGMKRNRFNRKRKKGHRGRTAIPLLFMLAVLAGLLVLGTQGIYAKDPMQPSIASKILRFHVLANSDSEEDQKLKEEVRDAIGAYLEPLLADAGSLEETKEIVTAHMEEIIETAERTMGALGYDYPVTAELTYADFPVKTYGDYTFPAGTYEALEVVIGEGEGHNWWCVLYPNMCFRGSVYEIVKEDAKEALKEVLSAEEYADVFSGGKYEIRFKFLDFFR